MDKISGGHHGSYQQLFYLKSDVQFSMPYLKIQWNIQFKKYINRTNTTIFTTIIDINKWIENKYITNGEYCMLD